MKKLNGFQLKILGLIFMLVDHINTFFGYELGLPRWVSFLGRFVAPVFLFLMMEGYIHTRDRKKYLGRLFLGAMVMHGVNIVINIYNKAYINPLTGEFDAFGLIAGNNIFWTLFLFMALFMILDKLVKNREGLKWLVLLFLILPLILFAEGGFYLFPIALGCFFFKNDPKKVSLVILIWSIALLAKTLVSYNSYGKELMTLYQQLAYSNEFMMASAIPLILLYNGKRGGNGSTWEKNLFYIFYPAHLVVLNLISIIMGK